MIHVLLLNNEHFVRLGALTMLINDSVNIFLLTQTLFYILFLSDYRFLIVKSFEI